MKSTPPKNRRQERRRKAAVGRLLSAIDRLIATAHQAEQARDELLRAAEQKGGGE